MIKCNVDIFDSYKNTLLNREVSYKNTIYYYDVPLEFYEEIDGNIYFFHACEWFSKNSWFRYKVIKFDKETFQKFIEHGQIENPFEDIFYIALIEEGKIISVEYTTHDDYKTIPLSPIQLK